MLRLAYAAVALPAEERDSFAAHLSGKRRHGAYEDHPHHGDAIRIAVDPAFKMRLLQLYGTQFDGLDPYAVFPKDLAEHFLHNEYFVMHAAD